MKFSCEKALLQSAIAITSRAVASKSSIPALEGLLLHADSQLTISGYNLQTGIRTKVSADVTESGLRRCDRIRRDRPERPPVRRHHPPDAGRRRHLYL